MRRLLNRAFRAGFGLSLLAAVATSACTAAGPPAAQPDSPAARALSSKIDVDFEATPLMEALSYLSQACPALGLSIDPEITREGSDFRGRTVTFKVKQLPVRAVLQLIIGRDLGFKATSGGVVIMTQDKLAKDVSSIRYPVKDLLDLLSSRTKAFVQSSGGGGAGADRLDYVPLDLLPCLSAYVGRAADPLVAPWQFKEGVDWRLDGDAIVLTQSARGHELIAEFLDLLRRACAAPADAAVTVPEPEEVASTRKRLEDTIDLDFEKTSLDNVLKYLCEVQRGLNIVVDRELQEAGVDLSTRVVDLKVKRVALTAVLHLILGGDLGYRVEPGYVWVTTRERLVSEGFPPLAYPVADILEAAVKHGLQAAPPVKDYEGPAPEQAYAGAVHEFERAYFTTVNQRHHEGVALWYNEGGPGLCEFLAGIMIVRQTPPGQAQSGKLLGLLRWAFALRDASLSKTAQPVPVMAAGEPMSPAEAETLRRLNEVVEVNFENTSVDVALKFLCEIWPGLNIVVDPDIAYDAGIDLSTRTVMLRGRVTVESAILSVLGEDLAYCPSTGYVLLTTREKAGRMLLVTLYPVADIIESAVRKNAPGVADGAAGGNARAKAVEQATRELIEGLVAAVNPRADPRVAAWKEEGECERVIHLAGVLIVRQTRRGHDKVMDFLNQRRIYR